MVKFYNFYACYLLQSTNPSHLNSVYVGSTPAPPRRIRQHNGIIKGGASKTSKKRPWDMVLIVHGFKSKVQALQFEWSWQNPHKTRASVSSSSTGRPKARRNGLKGTLTSLNQILSSSRLPLGLHFNSERVCDVWRGLGVEFGHIEVSIGTMEMLMEADMKEGDLVFYENLVNCHSKQCKSPFHLLCISKHLLNTEPTSLIPTTGLCPKCDDKLYWGKLIMPLRKYLHAISNEVEDTSVDDGEKASSESSDSEDCLDLKSTKVGDLLKVTKKSEKEIERLRKLKMPDLLISGGLKGGINGNVGKGKVVKVKKAKKVPLVDSWMDFKISETGEAAEISSMFSKLNLKIK